MTNPLTMVTLVNAAIGRHIATMFPGYFKKTNTKHNHYADFGYPEELSFDQLYMMYRRNGFAAAAVNKTKSKTWQGDTFLLERKRDGAERKKSDKETPLEKDIRLAFRKLRFWQGVAEADRRAMVSGYSALLLKFGDGKDWDQPVERLAGLDKFLGFEVIWSKQMRVSDWHVDPADKENYGKPKMFDFQESPIDQDQADKNPSQRTMKIHPDRVFIWSEDGTVLGQSLLQPGYNDLVDIEKIKGAGGEGFWKNAKSAPVLETDDPTTTFAEMAKAMNVTQEDLHKKMNEQVANFNGGFDQLLMLQGMKAKTLAVSLPSPEHFFAVPLSSFAASVGMPTKILIGNQQGERASTEDSEEWDQTIMGRRSDYTHPLLLSLCERFENFGILPAGKDWHVDQSDLTEAKVSEKVERALKMSQINTQSKNADGMLTFTVDEVREVVDYEPGSPELLEVDDPEADQPKDKLNDN